MRCVIVIIPLAFLAQAHGKELVASENSDALELKDALVGKLISKVIVRALKVWSLHPSGLDNATLAKTRPDHSHLTIYKYIRPPLSIPSLPSLLPRSLPISHVSQRAEAVDSAAERAFVRIRHRSTLRASERAIRAKIGTVPWILATEDAAVSPIFYGFPQTHSLGSDQNQEIHSLEYDLESETYNRESDQKKRNAKTPKTNSSVTSAGVLLWVDDETVVIGLNAKKGYMDFGGKMRSGESPEECAKRELIEETGLDPSTLSIDWCAPEYLRRSKYTVYYGSLGGAWPRPSKELTSFSVVKVSALPQNSNQRLRAAVANARGWLAARKATGLSTLC